MSASDLAMPYYVYILASRKNGTLYTGITNDIARRIHEHRTGTASDFTRRYSVQKLVYIETHNDVEIAISREKRIKRWRRAWKIELIEANNHDWCDLFDDIQR